MLKIASASLRAAFATCLLLSLIACGSVASTPTNLTISPYNLPSGTVGSPYTQFITAANGTPPYSFSITAGAAPAGLTLSSGGILSGTPGNAAAYSFVVTAVDARSVRATQAYNVTIAPAVTTLPVSITNSALPSGTVGATYTGTVVAANGTTPYSFAVSAGTLPAGLSLSPTTGVISGIPLAAGSSSFTVTVTDAQSQKASAPFSITIASAGVTPVSINTPSLPAATVGVRYSASVTAVNGTPPYTFTLSSGTLPGLSLSAEGALTGVPAASGSFPIVVTVTDANLQTASANYTLVVAPASTGPLSITTPSLPQGTVGTEYTAPITAINGTPPYAFSLASGSLPGGLNLSPQGVVYGNPTTAGTYNFTVAVQDAASQKTTAMYTLVIAAAGPLAITNNTVPAGTVGVSYYTTVLVANGTQPYLFTFTGGALPTGLALSPVGVISGTPTSSGTFTFSVSVSDANSQSTSQTYRLVIAPAVAPLAIVNSTLPPGTVSVAYSAPVVASNGVPPYTFAVSSGTPPPGLNLSPSTGVLSGTPTTAGTSNFTVTATDATSHQVSQPYSVTVSNGSAASLTIGPATLPAALSGASYTALLPVSGGAAPYNVVQTGGTLPAGIALSSSGVLSGTAAATGAYSFTARVTDGSSPQQSASATFTLNVVNATVAIDTTSVVTTVPQTFFGIHTSVYDTSLNDVSRLPSLLQATGITTLRYPGGSYADRYHWAQFSLTPLYASAPGACGQIDDGSLGSGSDFGSFVRTLLATGTQALITVNYGSSVANSSASLLPGSNGVANHCSDPNTAGQPEEAAAWVAYANGSPANTQVIGTDAAGFNWRTVGFWAGLRAASPVYPDDGYNFLRIGHAAPVGIKYWELGNEMYYNGWSGNRNYEEDVHAPYIYPGGYSGSYESRNQLPALSPSAYGSNAVAFVQAMKAVDPTILIGVDFASPGATDPIPLDWNPDLAQAVCAGTNLDLAIIHYYPGTYNAVQPGELLSLPESDLPRVISGIKQNLAQSCPDNSSSIQFWLTETSPNGNLGSGFPNQVVGLFALNDYMTSLENGVVNIDWLELHNGTYLDESENPGPAYYGIELAHLLAAPGDSVVTATSSSPTILSFATRKTTTGQKGVLLINASSSGSQVVQVTVAGSTLGASATQYSYGLGTSQSGTMLQQTAFPVSGNSFSITVPPFTAVELLIP